MKKVKNYFLDYLYRTYDMENITNSQLKNVIEIYVNNWYKGNKKIKNYLIKEFLD